MKSSLAIVLVSFLGLQLGACGAGDAFDKFGRQGDAIMYGDPDTNPDHMAVVALSNNSRDLFCTGTLITPDVILTAGHCAMLARWGGAFDPVQVFFGTEFGGTGTTITGTDPLDHPEFDFTVGDYDIGLIRLTEPAPAGITPIPYLPASLGLTTADEDESVEFAGFGRTETGSSGVKLHVFGNIELVCPGPSRCTMVGEVVEPYTFGFLENPGGPCRGDSGGPAFLIRNGTEYVAGATSYGDEPCVKYGVSTDVSYFADWIAEYIGVVDESCDNGIDDDGDGKIDCLDSDCAADAACQTTPENCVNGVDDDGDSQIDCQDSDCSADAACQTASENCVNGSDDDGDGLVDCLDPDCANAPSCQAAAEVCQNGLDDDGDGYTDCQDLDCVNDAACQSSAENCQNGIDDDADGLADCLDPDCASNQACAQPAEDCANQFDDDHDGLIDCADIQDCGTAAVCQAQPSSSGCVSAGGHHSGLIWLWFLALAIAWRPMRGWRLPE